MSCWNGYSPSQRAESLEDFGGIISTHRGYTQGRCIFFFLCPRTRVACVLLYLMSSWFLLHWPYPCESQFSTSNHHFYPSLWILSWNVPHFDLLKFPCHNKPSMRDKMHQMVGGASLELHHGRKSKYLGIPLKDNNRGWHYEWFIIENHEFPPCSLRKIA